MATATVQVTSIADRRDRDNADKRLQLVSVPTYDTIPVQNLDLKYTGLRLPNPESMTALRSSISRHGILQPLVVNREEDSLVLLDGFKRRMILSEQKEALVPIRILSLSTEQAKAALLLLNRPHRGLCELEEAWVVASLVREHKLPQVEVSRLLGRHKSWVCRRLQLVEVLEPGVVEDMRLGLLLSTFAREWVRLPRGNQSQVAESLRKHGLTSRQAHELVNRLIDGDSEHEAELLADPLRFLASQPKRPVKNRDPRLSQAGEKVRQMLLYLEHQAMVTNRALCVSRLGALPQSDRDILTVLGQAIVPLLEDDIEAIGQISDAKVNINDQP